MAWEVRRLAAVLVSVAFVATAAACGDGAEAATESARSADGIARVTTTTASTTTSTTTTLLPTTVPPLPTTAAPPPPATVAPPTTRPHPARFVHEQAWVPYAVVGPVTLHHPSDHVEAIGFHQSGHDGAQHQTAVEGAARWFVQEGRDRDTDLQGAADIVVEPDREVRVPVTGTVLRAGTYTLYCDNVDQYAVIEPDARPGWEVKVLHIEGLALTVGQRVEAGVTRLADHARVLPFASTVEDDTAVPGWPHVHVEVVDPSVKDRPTGPGCP
jgi:hypothetical protein